MSCGAVDGRRSCQRPELPCSSQFSPCSFFHMGAPLHTATEQGETAVVLLSISVSQRAIRDDRCVSAPPSLFTPRNTIYDIQGSAAVSGRSSKHTHMAQDSSSSRQWSSADSPCTHTTLCTILHCFEKKSYSIPCLVVMSSVQGWVWWVHCIVWRYENVVSKTVMIKCPLVKLKGQKQLVFFDG